MIFKFEELKITINGREFLIDGRMSIDKQEDEIVLVSFYDIAEPFDVDSENFIPWEIIDWDEVEKAIEQEFYKSDSPLYNDALQFWEDRK